MFYLTLRTIALQLKNGFTITSGGANWAFQQQINLGGKSDVHYIAETTQKSATSIRIYCGVIIGIVKLWSAE